MSGATGCIQPVPARRSTAATARVAYNPWHPAALPQPGLQRQVTDIDRLYRADAEEPNLRFHLTMPAGFRLELPRRCDALKTRTSQVRNDQRSHHPTRRLFLLEAAVLPGLDHLSCSAIVSRHGRTANRLPDAVDDATRNTRKIGDNGRVASAHHEADGDGCHREELSMPHNAYSPASRRHNGTPVARLTYRRRSPCKRQSPQDHAGGTGGGGRSLIGARSAQSAGVVCALATRLCAAADAVRWSANAVGARANDVR